MGLFELFGIRGMVAPISSFFEMVKSFRGNREDAKELSSDDVVIGDNQEKQTEEE